MEKIRPESSSSKKKNQNKIKDEVKPIWKEGLPN